MKRKHYHKRKKHTDSGIVQLTLNFNIDLPGRDIRRLTNEDLFNRQFRTADTGQRAINSKIDLPEWVFRLALKQLSNELYRRRR